MGGGRRRFFENKSGAKQLSAQRWISTVTTSVETNKKHTPREQHGGQMVQRPPLISHCSWLFSVTSSQKVRQGRSAHVPPVVRDSNGMTVDSYPHFFVRLGFIGRKLVRKLQPHWQSMQGLGRDATNWSAGDVVVVTPASPPPGP